jgi:hypothetical protein
MHRSRTGLRVVGLCLTATVALMAFAASAQAEAGANWRVKGVNVNGTLLPELQIKEIENKTASLLLTTKGGTKFELLCTTAALSGAKLTTSGSITQSTVEFSNCTVKLNGEVSAPCKPGNGTGIVKTNPVKGLLVLVSAGVPVVSFKPVSGEVLTVIELGVKCSIAESIEVKGVLNLKDCQSATSTELTDHLIEEGPGTTLTALGVKATLDGSALVHLVGAHAGLTWSGVPA